ncbi:MAG TPA: hypothetical protein VFT22_07225 [Kofleriaceae bacterium]|nr:hypothetical protein [Kofleriaceae bacterium]
MLALTVWQPWASLIVGSPTTDGCPGAPPQKNVENRDMRPWLSAIGKRIAIHAGLERRRNMESYEDVFLDKSYGEVAAPYRTPADFPRGAVVGVALLAGVSGPMTPSMFYDTRFDGLPPEAVTSWQRSAGDLRWFTGPWGWVLCDQRWIRPVPCRGALGLWSLPAEVERDVCAQIASAA